MYDSQTIGASRLHFALQCSTVQFFYWALLMSFGFLGEKGNQWATGAELSLLLLAASLLEKATRPPAARVLCGLSKDERWSVSHRQILFLLGTLTGHLILHPGLPASAPFLVSFLALATAWTAWSNVAGFRLIHRYCYRRKGKRPEAAVAVSNANPAAARAR